LLGNSSATWVMNSSLLSLRIFLFCFVF
jgi:hypothetical protein